MLNGEESCKMCQEVTINNSMNTIFKVDFDSHNLAGKTPMQCLLSNPKFATPAVLKLYEKFLATHIPLLEREQVVLLYALYNVNVLNMYGFVSNLSWWIREYSSNFAKALLRLLKIRTHSITQVMENAWAPFVDLVLSQADTASAEWIMPHVTTQTCWQRMPPDVVTYMILTRKLPLDLSWKHELYHRYVAGDRILFRSNAHLLTTCQKITAQAILLCLQVLCLPKYLVFLILQY